MLIHRNSPFRHRQITCWLLALLAAPLSQLSFAETYYKWVDENRVIHYSRNIPPGDITRKYQVISEIGRASCRERV